jgi:SAM-dependent methyltransferase
MAREYQPTIQEVYREHHRTRERYGFVFGGDLRASLIAQALGQGRKILDLGCRDGSLTRFYASDNQVYGVDVDIEALSLCRTQLKIPVLLCDLNEGLPFKEASFDAVVAGEVLEHLPYPWMLIREVHRVLKVGGIFVGSVPNAYHWRKRWRFLLGKDLEEDPTHLRLFSRDILQKMLEQEKMGDIRIIPWAGQSRKNPLKRWALQCWPDLFCTGFIFLARKSSSTETQRASSSLPTRGTEEPPRM